MEFKSVGGDAMEVAQPQQAPSERQFLGLLSQEYELLCSQGSDFHFPSRFTELGRRLDIPLTCKPVWHSWNLATSGEEIQ